MSRKTTLVLAILLLSSCSRLDALTPELLESAQSKWIASKPESYRLVIEMKGDRVEKEQFEVIVRGGRMETLHRNGSAVAPRSGQDYSMDGLFHMLRQELDLAGNPTLLGAPAGYSAYTMARFDEQSGRLMEYRRTVGGTANSIEIRVLEYQ